jgi:hypothetical protein
MLKALAGKHDSSVSKMAAKYKTTTDIPHGPRKCFQVSVNRGEGRKPLVGTFGGIPLKRQKNAVLTDRQPVPDAARRKRLGTKKALAPPGCSPDGLTSASWTDIS